MMISQLLLYNATDDNPLFIGNVDVTYTTKNLSDIFTKTFLGGYLFKLEADKALRAALAAVNPVFKTTDHVEIIKYSEKSLGRWKGIVEITSKQYQGSTIITYNFGLFAWFLTGK